MGAIIVADTVRPEAVPAVQALEQRACKRSAPLRDLGRGKIDVPQDLSRSCVKGRAILGQREPARGALHEPGPKTPLKVRQALADNGLRYSQAPSCGNDGSGFGDRRECHEGFQLEHCSISPNSETGNQPVKVANSQNTLAASGAGSSP